MRCGGAVAVSPRTGRDSRVVWRSPSIVVVLLLVAGFALAFGPVAQAATFVVSTTSDSVDVLPGDGVCADATGACSLRAAVQEANALAGFDRIELPAGTFGLSLAGPWEEDRKSVV